MEDTFGEEKSVSTSPQHRFPMVMPCGILLFRINPRAWLTIFLPCLCCFMFMISLPFDPLGFPRGFCFFYNVLAFSFLTFSMFLVPGSLHGCSLLQPAAQRVSAAHRGFQCWWRQTRLFLFLNLSSLRSFFKPLLFLWIIFSNSQYEHFP